MTNNNTTTPAAATTAERAALYAERTAGKRWTIHHGPKSRAAGRRGETWTADEVAELIPEGGMVALYVSFGHVNGLECFGLDPFMREGDSLVRIGSDGVPTHGYPLGEGRTMRLLVK